MLENTERDGNRRGTTPASWARSRCCRARAPARSTVSRLGVAHPGSTGGGLAKVKWLNELTNDRGPVESYELDSGPLVSAKRCPEMPGGT